jgi:hypothetical protein
MSPHQANVDSCAPLYAAEKQHENERVDAPACSPSKLLRRIDALRFKSVSRSSISDRRSDFWCSRGLG